MEKPFILHMFTSEKNLSPFDVNMALDAGWISTIPYTNVEIGEVQALVQDTVFSRSLSGLKRTGIFIGGRSAQTAIEMLKIAKQSMFPPFELCVLADPSGAFTTAAAMVALVENNLIKKFNTTLEGKSLLILGGTGPVGQAAAFLAASSGAKVKIVGRQLEKSQNAAKTCTCEFGGGKTNIEGDADANKSKLMETADVVLATAAAGIQILGAELIAASPKLKIAADVNAVPPSGVAGLDTRHDGSPLPGSPSGAIGFGALAIGDVKYHTQHILLETMRDSNKPLFLSFVEAFKVAREYLKDR